MIIFPFAGNGTAALEWDEIGYIIRNTVANDTNFNEFTFQYAEGEDINSVWPGKY